VDFVAARQTAGIVGERVTKVGARSGLVHSFRGHSLRQRLCDVSGASEQKLRLRTRRSRNAYASECNRSRRAIAATTSRDGPAHDQT
jgi:hypothetical protein